MNWANICDDDDDRKTISINPGLIWTGLSESLLMEQRTDRRILLHSNYFAIERNNAFKKPICQKQTKWLFI